MVIAGHQVERFDLRGEILIEVVHLELPLEIRNCAQAFHDDRCSMACRECRHQLGERVDIDIAEMGYGLLNERNPILNLECHGLMPGIADDRNDHSVEDPCGALDDVDVSESDRVVRPWADRDAGIQLLAAQDGAWNIVTRVDP